MRWSLIALVLLSPLLGAGACGPPLPGPPSQAGDCRNGPGAPAVVPGTGESGFVALADDAETQLNFGPQGGEHVWTAVKATGFGARQVKVSLEAKDAFSGAPVGAGAAFEVHLNALAGQPQGTCDFHGVPLFLEGRFRKSGGLVELTATVTADDGTTATGTKRIWIGQALPVCVPAAHATPTVTPTLVTPDGAAPVPLADGERLSISSISSASGSPTLVVGALTTDLAASALTLHAELRDPNADASAPPLASADSLPGSAPAEPALTTDTPARCQPQTVVSLPLDALAGAGTVDALLVLSAADGQGDTATAQQHLTLVP